MLGTLVAGVAALTLIALFPQERWWFMVLLSVYIGFCTYLMTGTKNLADAKTFVDWAVSEAAIEIYAGRYSVVAMPVKTKKWDHFPPEVQNRMINNDFAWAAKNKARIVSEWRRRYDGKTEPKK